MRRMAYFLGRHWPLMVALGALYLIVGTFFWLVTRQNQGHFAYVLDDAYIHMAVAKNLWLHGVWGVTRFGFTSCSSSLLWPIVLALSYGVTGVNELNPLILNLIFGSLLLGWVYGLLLKSRAPRPFILLALGLLILLTPMPAMIFSGMEHLLHALMTVAFASLASAALARPEMKIRDGWRILALAPLVFMARYEGAFLLGAVGLIFLIRGRVLFALVMEALGALPVIVFGVISMVHGWFFFPNSILIKSLAYNKKSIFDLNHFFKMVLGRLTNDWTQTILLVVVIALLVIRTKAGKRLRDRKVLMGLIFIPVFVLHTLLIDSALFLRYEAYLVCFGLTTIFVMLPDTVRDLRALWKRRGEIKFFQRKLALVVLTGLAFSPILGGRVAKLYLAGTSTLGVIVPASNNIYEQQIQMGHFLKKYYTGQGVALNDIGAANYFADIRCLDLVGLGSMETAVARKLGELDAATLLRLARGAGTKIAMVYETWSGWHLPAEWIRVGRWKIPRNTICAEATVSIYAVDPAEREGLTRNLAEFRKELPADVVQEGAYLQRPGLDAGERRDL